MTPEADIDEDNCDASSPAVTATSLWHRRTFLGRIVISIQALVGGIVGGLATGAIASPMFQRREDESWVTASQLAELTQNVPAPVAIDVARDDGYRRIVERRVLFLVRTGDQEVLALDPTCTHLGCRVRWNPEARELKCPCHGGAYTATGDVKAGPPPAPLQRVETRLHENVIQVRV